VRKARIRGKPRPQIPNRPSRPRIKSRLLKSRKMRRHQTARTRRVPQPVAVDRGLERRATRPQERLRTQARANPAEPAPMVPHPTALRPPARRRTRHPVPRHPTPRRPARPRLARRRPDLGPMERRPPGQGQPDQWLPYQPVLEPLQRLPVEQRLREWHPSPIRSMRQQATSIQPHPWLHRAEPRRGRRHRVWFLDHPHGQAHRAALQFLHRLPPPQATPQRHRVRRPIRRRPIRRRLPSHRRTRRQVPTHRHTPHQVPMRRRTPRQAPIRRHTPRRHPVFQPMLCPRLQ